MLPGGWVPAVAAACCAARWERFLPGCPPVPGRSAALVLPDWFSQLSPSPENADTRLEYHLFGSFSSRCCLVRPTPQKIQPWKQGQVGPAACMVEEGWAAAQGHFGPGDWLQICSVCRQAPLPTCGCCPEGLVASLGRGAAQPAAKVAVPHLLCQHGSLLDRLRGAPVLHTGALIDPAGPAGLLQGLGAGRECALGS